MVKTYNKYAPRIYYKQDDTKILPTYAYSAENTMLSVIINWSSRRYTKQFGRLLPYK